MRFDLSYGALPVLAACALLVLGSPSRAETPLPRAASGVEETILKREGTRDTTGLATLVRGAGVTSSVRARAARALGHVGERGSVPALASALRDPSPMVRREAAFALGLTADTSAIAPLLERLPRESDLATRTAIVTSLGNAGGGGRPRAALSRALTGSILSTRPAERGAAAFAGARLRDSSLVEPLRLASRDRRPEVRWKAAYALGKIGDRAAAVALRKLSFDKDPMVRAVAARAMGEVGDSGATARLGGLLHDVSWRVRVNAAFALGALKIRREARTLLPFLADPHAHVRWQAAGALGEIGDSLAVPALTKALGDSSTGVTQAAAVALLKIQGDRAVATVAPSLDLLPAFLRGGLAEALGDVEGPAALEVMLARARQTSDPAQAAGAVTALSKRPEARATSLPVLRPLLQDRDFTVVCSAAEALGTLGDSTAVSAIATLFARRTTPQDDDVRASAATGLASLATANVAAAREALGAVRNDPDRRVRDIASRALGAGASAAADPAPAAAPLTLRATPATASRRLTAVVTTERGVITLALDPTRAPENVENFAALARAGYFDGISFHRVVPNFVIQAGCPRGDGWGGPGYAIPCEYSDAPYEIGTVGMALSGKDTGGSQWFITLSPQPRLEGRYSVMGKVSAGIEVVERIMPGDRILKVAIR